MLAGLLVTSATLAHAASDPGTSVSSPLPGDTFSGSGATRSVTFSGFIAAPSTVTSIGVDVLKAPDLDPSVDANWLKNVVTTPPTSGGTYSVTLTSGRAGIPARAWPDGGIAKTRVMSNMPDGTRFQTFVQDRQGVPTLDNILMLTDIDPSPTSFTATPRRIDLTPNYLNAKDSLVPHFSDPTAQKNETIAYYNAVRTCQGNASTSCASTLANLSTLSAFKSRYLTNNGNGTLIEAKYYNLGDLGIGRDMICNVSSAPSGITQDQENTVEVACAVSNYAPVVGGNTVFDDQTGSFAAMDATNPVQAPFATVVMVYRGYVLGGSLNRTYFAVYGSDGSLDNAAAKLDNKAYNTFIPGNCEVCHGGGSQYDSTNHGVYNAYFLPFDLNAFGFNANHTRAAQEDTFRKLNYEALLAGTGSLPAAAEVVNGWYSNKLSPFAQSSPPAQNNAFVPTGWNGTARTRDFYSTVVAPNCRGCHLTSFNYPFRSSTELINSTETGPGTFGGLAIADVCNLRRMPNAEQSEKHGWTDPTRAASLRAMLLTHIPQSCTSGGVCKTFNQRCDPRNPVATSILKNDFDGDGITDFTVWLPNTGTWSLVKSSDPATTPTITNQQWGVSGDIPVPADYDADGKTDFAVYRPSTATWFVIPSGNPSAAFSQQWGQVGDKPVPGDYDKDGKVDFTVWRPSNGTWYVLLSSMPGYYYAQQWGVNGDVPLAADYDGDGFIDYGVWRPSTGYWYVIKSTDGSLLQQQWGVSTDWPLLGDFDGDGKTDFTVYRPSTGIWYIVYSKSGRGAALTFGAPNSPDRPVTGDFDGDGFTDMAIFHALSGNWEVLSSARGGFDMPTYATLGIAADVTPY